MAEKKQPTPPAAPDAGASQVQAKMDEETDQGFRGVKVDPTPNEAYTVQGVTSGAPTPETEPPAPSTEEIP